MMCVLFLHLDCAGRVRPWSFVDKYALNVRIYNTESWIKETKEDLRHLKKIMKKEMRYYLDRDMRIYNRIAPNYEDMVITVEKIDSTIGVINSKRSDFNSSKKSELESIHRSTGTSYRETFELDSKEIQLLKKRYYKSLKRLKKGFRKDRKKLVFIHDEHEDSKKVLDQLRYKREKIEDDVIRFNKVLTKALFKGEKSFYSIRIIKLSKSIEEYISTLDNFESFLINIDDVAYEEAGSRVMLRSSKKAEPMNYLTTYDRGVKEYIKTLKKITDVLKTI